jgi:hypothetical protein
MAMSVCAGWRSWLLGAARWGPHSSKGFQSMPCPKRDPRRRPGGSSGLQSVSAICGMARRVCAVIVTGAAKVFASASASSGEGIPRAFRSSLRARMTRLCASNRYSGACRVGADHRVEVVHPDDLPDGAVHGLDRHLALALVGDKARREMVQKRHALTLPTIPQNFPVPPQLWKEVEGGPHPAAHGEDRPQQPRRLLAAPAVLYRHPPLHPAQP